MLENSSTFDETANLFEVFRVEKTGGIVPFCKRLDQGFIVWKIGGDFVVVHVCRLLRTANGM